jgi:hypothetical protein
MGRRSGLERGHPITASATPPPQVEQAPVTA